MRRIMLGDRQAELLADALAWVESFGDECELIETLNETDRDRLRVAIESFTRQARKRTGGTR